MNTQTLPTTTQAKSAITAVDTKLEVIILPVADAERSKAFYTSLGWRLDADLAPSEDARVLQFTPTGSDASIIFGTGVTDATPGSVSGLLLAVTDIDAAHDELVARGIDVSEVFHDTSAVFGSADRKPGPAPEHADYQSFVSFSDPDGNAWILQEVRNRLPGRVTNASYRDADALAEALRRAAEAHGRHEELTGEYDAEWPEWYATYMVREQTGEELPV